MESETRNSAIWKILRLPDNFKVDSEHKQYSDDNSHPLPALGG